MPRKPIEDWLSLLESEAAKRDVPVDIDLDDQSFHFELRTDDTVIGKVRISNAEDRNYEDEQGQEYIWQRFDREQERLEEDPEQRVCSIQLDIHGDDYDPREDHFLFIPGEIILEETYSKGDQKIFIEGPGQYSGDLARFADDWEALFEYATGSLSLDEYTPHSMDRSLVNDETTVWIEKTELEGREYKQEGELRLGQAVYSPSRSESGSRIYEELREAEVGDIVIHLLQDRGQIVGVSTIESELEEGWEGHPDFDWTEEQRQQGGYRRWLTDYEEFEQPVDIYADILDNADYTAALNRIRENYDRLFYDRNLDLVEGFYLTRCPDELVSIIAQEQGSKLTSYLQDAQDSWTPSEDYEYRAAWLADRYRADRDWDSLRATAENTHQAVRLLLKAIIDNYERIDTAALTTLFRICQHENQIRVETKREAVNSLSIGAEAKENVIEYIDQGTGSVGGPNFNLEVPNPETGETLLNLFEEIFDQDSDTDLDEVVAQISELNIDGIQAGTLSPILHYLYPTKFPIINGLVVDGVDKYFQEDFSKSFDEYLTHCDTYRTIRDQYGFKEHFRDIDYFFVWADNKSGDWDHDWTWMLTDEGGSVRDTYVIQPGASGSDGGFDERQVLWPAWQEHDIISVGGEDGDLRHLSEEQRKRRGEEPDWGAGAAWETLMDMSPGDIVIAKYGTDSFVGIGVVDSESYEYQVKGPGYQPTEDGGSTAHPHIRSVSWVCTDSDGWSYDEFGLSKSFVRDTAQEYDHFEEFRYKFGNYLETGVSTFSELEAKSRDRHGKPATEFTGGSSTDSTANILGSQSGQPAIDIDQSKLLADLYFPDQTDLKNTIYAALMAGQHIVFTGPPGTGKTELAENISKALVEHDELSFTGYKLTTATSDWTTFDTVGGRIPADDEDSLVFSPGFILQRFKQDGAQRNDLLIIDELNRADIDKAFGQLFTVLSGQSVQLPFEIEDESVEVIPQENYAGTDPEPHEFVVPEQWRLIATMNSYDKTSLYEMSYAFMRRLTFIEVQIPDLNGENATESPIEFMAPYLAIWYDWEDTQIDRDTLETEAALPRPEDVEAVVDAWQTLTTGDNTRPVGPALVEDMLRLMDGHEGPLEKRIADAIVAYIYPQLEGIPDREEIVAELVDIDAVDPAADRLRGTAATMLDISFDDDEDDLFSYSG